MLEELPSTGFFLYHLSIVGLHFTKLFWKSDFHQIVIVRKLMLQLFGGLQQVFGEVYHIKVCLVGVSAGATQESLALDIMERHTGLIVVNHSWPRSAIYLEIYFLLAYV